MMMVNDGKTLYRNSCLGLVVAMAILFSPSARAQDDLANRRAAAERYEATMPIAKMMEESIQQMAAALPEDQRSTFVAQMEQVVDGKRLRLIALDQMIQVFSTEELDALAAFYGSPVGQSIVTKFPVYIAEVMPLIQLELARAVRELEDSGR
jgi:hypothetical protein